MKVVERALAVALMVFAAMAANLQAAPTLKALWLTNAQNTNSVKPAIDRLAKRLGVGIAFEKRDITALEEAKTISADDEKRLHEINPDFVVMTFGENVKCKTPYGAEMNKWIRFFKSFRAIPNRPELLMCANMNEKNRTDRSSPVWRTLDAAASRGHTDYLMTGDLDAEGIHQRIADVLHARTFPRIVPIAPKLSEIDPATGEIELYYSGRFPKGRGSYRLDAGVDGVRRASAAVGDDGHVKLRLGEMTEGAHSLRVQLSDLTLGHHPAVSRSIYQINARKLVAYSAGKRLNNLVTELYAGPVGGRAGARPSHDDIKFVNPCDGCVAVELTGCGSEAEARIDGSGEAVVKFRPGEPMFGMRWLAAGEHVVTVKGAAAGGRIAVRAVKVLLSCSANGKWTELYRRFVNPYTNIGSPYDSPGLAGAFTTDAPEDNGIVRLSKRGCRIIPDLNMSPQGLALRRDIRTVEDTIAGCTAWRLGMSVNIDENRVGVEMGDLHHYTMAEAIWRLSTPSQSIGMWWAGCRDGNVFRSASRLASELSAISNSGSGRGLHLFETYQRSSRKVADVERQFNDTIACIRSMVELVPATKEGIFCYMGTYYFPGDYSALASPYADHRVLLDMWARRLSTDPSLAGMLAGFGSGDYNFTDEEMVRWISAILKHYAIEGGTDSMAERFGYRYNPGFVENPDFDEGLKGWQPQPAADGAISTLKVADYGEMVQGRQFADGAGDRMALFVRNPKKPNALLQNVKGLVPGRHYALVFYSSDYDEYLGVKGKKPDVPQGRRRLRVRFTGGTNVSGLEIHSYGPGRFRRGKLSICRNRYVFKANSPEVTIAIIDRADGEGHEVSDDIGLRQVVNFVEMHEYYTGGLSVDEIALLMGK